MLSIRVTLSCCIAKSNRLQADISCCSSGTGGSHWLWFVSAMLDAAFAPSQKFFKLLANINPSHRSIYSFTALCKSTVSFVYPSGHFLFQSWRYDYLQAFHRENLLHVMSPVSSQYSVMVWLNVFFSRQYLFKAIHPWSACCSSLISENLFSVAGMSIMTISTKACVSWRRSSSLLVTRYRCTWQCIGCEQIFPWNMDYAVAEGH